LVQDIYPLPKISMLGYDANLIYLLAQNISRASQTSLATTEAARLKEAVAPEKLPWEPLQTLAEEGFSRQVLTATQ
jgi:hypothetical protein